MYVYDMIKEAFFGKKSSKLPDSIWPRGEVHRVDWYQKTTNSQTAKKNDNLERNNKILLEEKSQGQLFLLKKNKSLM